MSDSPVRPDIEAALARADAATEGPWTLDRTRGIHVEGPVFGGAPDGRTLLIRVDGRRADARFIAAARTDVPALACYALALEADAALLAILRDCRRHLSLVTTAIPIGAVPGRVSLAAMADTLKLIDQALGENTTPTPGANAPRSEP